MCCLPDITEETPTMGTHRPPPGPRVGSKLGTTLAATAAIVAVPMTGEMPVASANVPHPTDPTTSSQPAVAPASVESTPAPAPHPAQDVYTVRRGDTLGEIGAALGVPWQDIAAANGITAPWTIYVDQALHVPSGRVTPPPAPAPAAVEAPASVSGGSAAATKAAQVAMAQLGDPYVWAAAGPNAFDCSGLVQYAYAAAGISLPHSSRTQATLGQAISRGDLRPGDLVAYYSPVSHIAIYIGNGKVVQAAMAGKPVMVTALDWAGSPTAYRRVA